jgi:hypothetical protein
MSKKIRCGHGFGIDLNQIWFWKRIFSVQGFSPQSQDEYLHLYISNEIIIIRKILPGGEAYLNDQITLEEKNFDKLREYLYEEFSCNLSE